MGMIIQRLSAAEQAIRDIQDKRSHIPVLIVREDTKGIFTYCDKVICGQEALQEFAVEHGSTAIIIDDIPRR